MQNLARFYTTSDFDREYLRNDSISKIGKALDRGRFLPRSTNQVRWTLVHYPESLECEFGPPKSTFWIYYISAPRGCWLFKFLHALEFDQALVAHVSIGVGVPLKILRANI